MLEKYLPVNIANALKCIPYESLRELRLRCNGKTIVNVEGENFYLNENGITKNASDAIDISIGGISSIIEKISNNSLHTINDDLINGYTTLAGGIRVGVCGEAVAIDSKVTTLKNISSLNFRFPHFVRNCSLNIYPYIVKNGRVKNTLIISPPGAGKTTYLRDLIYQMTNREELLNILLVDERNELSSVFNGEMGIRLPNIDIYSRCSKNFGFINGIRSMKPDVIVTDEINIEKDLEIIEMALTSGVSVVASLHASNIKDIRSKIAFKHIIEKSLFERYVFLSADNGVGTLDGVFDENLEFIGV